MAQTRKKRQTKHRGNAAGVVEARGRTGRKPTAAEKKKAQAQTARDKRLQRYDTPPTWKSATQRALIAGALMFAIGIPLLGSVVRAAILLPFVLGMYIPVGYYTDLYLYKRRQREKAKGRA